MMFGGFEAGWAYAPMPPAASAAVPRAVLHRRVRRVTPGCHRIGVSFVQRKSTLSANKPSNEGADAVIVRRYPGHAGWPASDMNMMRRGRAAFSLRASTHLPAKAISK